MPKKLDKNLLKGKRWIIDGANGSEIQRLGEEECTGDFGAMSTLTQANIVEKVHRLYVEAGANFIIANTYSSNYNILSSYNQEEKCKGLIEESIALTNKAVAGVEDRYVAASISEHPPFDDNLKLIGLRGAETLSFLLENRFVKNWTFNMFNFCFNFF